MNRAFFPGCEEHKSLKLTEESLEILKCVTCMFLGFKEPMSSAYFFHICSVPFKPNEKSRTIIKRPFLKTGLSSQKADRKDFGKRDKTQKPADTCCPSWHTAPKSCQLSAHTFCEWRAVVDISSLMPLEVAVPHQHLD